jgi:hypothetical protein
MMKELVASGNALTKLMVTALAPSLPGATVGGYISNCAIAALMTFKLTRLLRLVLVL